MKWKLLTYNQKKKILILGSVIIFLLCYQYAFKKTWLLINECNENKLKTEKLNNYLLESVRAKKDEQIVNALLKNNVSDTANFERITLAFITTFCKEHNLALTDYQPLQKSESSNFTICTRQVTAEGTYINLLSLLFDIETSQSFGRVRSVIFKSIVETTSGLTKLRCTFYLQNLVIK